MEFHVIPWYPHGISWNSMEFHGIPWNSMEFHNISRNSMEVHGIPWNSVKFHGIHEIPWGYHGALAIPKFSIKYFDFQPDRRQFCVLCV